MGIKNGAFALANLPGSARWIANPADAAQVGATKEQIMTNETGGRKLLFLMSREQAEIFARLLGAAERGDGAAACQLGDMYREGRCGLRYSPKETYRWYARSALAGDANGQNNLGACYEHALGCVQSYVRAVKWCRLAEAQGLGTAAMNLGYCYLRGHGVPADKGEALRLFRLAVERGEDRAAQEVERLEGASGYGRIPKGFKDRTKEGMSIALVGGVTPRWENEGIRPELLQVLKSGEAEAPVDENPESGHATEEELFPIFAEGGMKPDDLVEGVAERYGEYLASQSRTGDGKT
jgi:TPR repeat protein